MALLSTHALNRLAVLQVLIGQFGAQTPNLKKFGQ
jgi:hypothetical protein